MASAWPLRLGLQQWSRFNGLAVALHRMLPVDCSIEGLSFSSAFNMGLSLKPFPSFVSLFVYHLISTAWLHRRASQHMISCCRTSIRRRPTRFVLAASYSTDGSHRICRLSWFLSSGRAYLQPAYASRGTAEVPSPAEGRNGTLTITGMTAVGGAATCSLVDATPELT